MRDIARLLRTVAPGMTADQARIADEAADEIDALRSKARLPTVEPKPERGAGTCGFIRDGDHWYKEWGGP